MQNRNIDSLSLGVINRQGSRTYTTERWVVKVAMFKVLIGEWSRGFGWLTDLRYPYKSWISYRFWLIIMATAWQFEYICSLKNHRQSMAEITTNVSKQYSLIHESGNLIIWFPFNVPQIIKQHCRLQIFAPNSQCLLSLMTTIV